MPLLDFHSIYHQVISMCIKKNLMLGTIGPQVIIRHVVCLPEMVNIILTTKGIQIIGM